MDTLNAKLRTEIGSSVARQMRRQERVPAVLYAKDMEPTPISVDRREFMRIIRAHGDSALITLTIEGRDPADQQAIYKNVQCDPLNTHVMHVDFQAVRAGQKVSITVPLHLLGNPVGVADQGGILMYAHKEITIACVPSKIPDFIEIDISSLGLHQSLHLGDVKLGEGLELDDNPETAVVSVVSPSRAEPEPTAAAEGEAAAEGAAPAEGAAAPAADAKKDAGKKDDKKGDKK